MAVPNIGDVLTTTLHYQRESMADAISNNNGLFYTLKKKGNIKKIPGGWEIREPLMYAENGTAMWYSGYDDLNITPSDVIDCAKFAWKQAAVAVSMSGYEQRINSGSKQQLKDLLKARIKVAQITMQNLLGTGVYALGTGSGGKEIGGMRYMFPTDETTGVMGGINRATWSFWQHTSYSGVTDGGAAKAATNIKRYFNKVFDQLVNGAEKPDLIVCGTNDYDLLLEALQAQQIFSDEKMAEAGFTTLKYRGATVLLDGGDGGACDADTSYFLNTDYLTLTAHQDCFMDALEPATRSSTNQDAFVKLIGFMGNMTCSNAKRFGVLTA